MRRVLRIWATLVVLAGIGLCGYVTVATNHVYVTTPSMWPTIPPGSLVFIQRESHYRVGDVIEFHGGGLDYMHRIIRINARGDITTKGDNPQNTPDLFSPPTTKTDVMGKAVLSIPYVGFPELILHHPLYGLSWLRAELGLWGRLLVVGTVAVFSALVTWIRTAPASARHLRKSHPPDHLRPQPAS